MPHNHKRSNNSHTTVLSHNDHRIQIRQALLDFALREHVLCGDVRIFEFKCGQVANIDEAARWQ